ncbi:hypothetical protein FJ250_07710 [bacterium]|nr:hypothetical protein [bacterium]
MPAWTPRPARGSWGWWRRPDRRRWPLARSAWPPASTPCTISCTWPAGAPAASRAASSSRTCPARAACARSSARAWSRPSWWPAPSS